MFQEFTHEAQNALLKLLEEPPATAQFYIITESKGGLLPTLVSRLVRFGIEESSEDSSRAEEIDAFFSASYADRLAYILERTNKKDDIWASHIMDAFETYAERNTDAQLMQMLCDIQPMFAAPGASKKMILEHLALLLPPKTQVR